MRDYRDKRHHPPHDRDEDDGDHDLDDHVGLLVSLLFPGFFPRPDGTQCHPIL